MTPDLVFWALFSIHTASFLWDLYLNYRQYSLYKRTETRPDSVKEIINEEDFIKARAYKLDKMHFGFFTGLLGEAQMAAILLLGLLPTIWAWSGLASKWIWPASGEIFQSIVLTIASSFVNAIISLPLSYYSTFVIEEKHGFNKQTVSFFFKDHVKQLAIGLILTAPIVAIMLWIILSGGRYFFVYVWLFLSAMIFIMMTIYPEFIAPLFDKYEPLPDSPLKTKIEDLAARLNYPLKKLYVVQGSKRSSHSNAYMYGFWNNKRIVLFDTLLNEEMNRKMFAKERDDEKKEQNHLPDDEVNKQKPVSEKPLLEEERDDEKNRKKKKGKGMSDDEVVAILGHELGHWKLSHTICNLTIAEVNMFAMLAVFAWLFRQPLVYRALGFTSGVQPILIGLFVILQLAMTPYNEFIGVAMSFLSRRFEFAADRFSAELGQAERLSSALIKLGEDNLTLPIDDWLYSIVNHSHPPVPERLEALKRYL